MNAAKRNDKNRMLERHVTLNMNRINIQTNGGKKRSKEYNRTVSALLVGVTLLILLFLMAYIIIHKKEVKPIPVENSLNYLYYTNRTNREMLIKISRSDNVVSCYYNTPNSQLSDQLMPSNIHPHLCTHINVAFAQIRNKNIYLDSEQYKTLSEVVLLKKTNPKLKVLLSIGGAQNDNGFSDMVINHASRKTFIKSIKSTLRNYTLDGIDLDWEFPMVHDGSVDKRERQHFSQLLREIRTEYIREKRNYLLTVAVAAPETIVDIAYDVDQINMYVDYVNIMTYDFHFFTTYTPFTGLNSPLYKRSTEITYMATLNIDYTVQMYLNKGLDRSKIVVGIPTYGHSFTLVNANNARVGSPASGFGALGEFVNYPDICKFIQKFKSEVTIVEDTDARVPYLYKNLEWVSFDTPQSVMEKAKYIKEHKLRGAMLYSLNADDFAGVCDSKRNGKLRFPLAESVKNVLKSEQHNKYLD